MKKLMALLLILGVSMVFAQGCLADPTIFKVYDGSTIKRAPIKGARVLIQGAMSGTTIANLITGGDGRTISVDLERCWKEIVVNEPPEPGTATGIYQGYTDTYLITISQPGYFTIKQYNYYFTYNSGIIEVSLKRATVPLNKIKPIPISR